MKHRVYLSVVAVLALASITSVGLAQCNRGTGGSPSAGSNSAGFAPQFASSGFNSPFVAQLNSQQLAPQLAMQRQMLAQQLQYRQALAQRQALARQQLARRQQLPPRQQVAQRQAGKRGQRSAGERQSTAASVARRDSVRQQNAEKVFASAQRAERRGDSRKAEKYYKRVVRILGPTSDLGERAETAIAAFTSDSDGEPTADESEMLELKSALASIE